MTAPEPDAQAAGAAVTVTAVVLNYDGRRLLEVILPSLAAQTYPNLRTLVVDNGSRDDSVAYLARDWPDVEVLALQANAGVAAALNRGVAAARGELVALLNNDLELEPDWIEQLVDALARHPEAATVACKLRNYSRRQVLDGAADELMTSMVARRRGAGEIDRGQYDTEQEVFAPTAGAALYRASALARVGPFDESFFAYYEDVDWGLRAQLAGLRTWYAPAAVGYHMGSATTGGVTNPFYWRLHRRNRIALIVKDLPLSVLIANARPILWEQAADLVSSYRRGMLGAHLQALAGAARSLPGWLRARRQIQRARRVAPEDIAAWLVPAS